MRRKKVATAGTISAGMPEWLTPKVDRLVSVALVYASIILGGYGLFVAIQRWLPSGIILIAIALVLQHEAMIGLRATYERIQQADSP
jgi:NADH:ubiquinone oxidoreductase subunit H